MNDFFADLFRKWCIRRTEANRELVRQASIKPPVVEQVETPVESISEELILHTIRERQRDGYIVLGKDQLFADVALRMQPPYDVGVPHGLSHIPESGDHYFSGISGEQVPPEYYPKKLEDIETPGDWINDIPGCRELTFIMDRLAGDIAHAVGVLVPADQLRFMLREKAPIVSIKLYTDTTWVEAGWGGPCISLSKIGDARVYTTFGAIPDDLTILTPTETMAPFIHFYSNELQRMFKSHYSVIEYKKAYERLMYTLNRLNITYR